MRVGHFIFRTTLCDKLFDPFTDEEIMRFWGLVPCQGQMELADHLRMPDTSSQTSSTSGRWPCCQPFGDFWFPLGQKAFLAPIAMPGASRTTQKSHKPNGLNLALSLLSDCLFHWKPPVPDQRKTAYSCSTGMLAELDTVLLFVL